jgi:hypothetical protein
MMARKYLLKHDKEDERDLRVEACLPEMLTKIPKQFDLRSVCPPVFDQGQQGSCTANAGCACRMMLDSGVPVLSRAFLYYQERSLEGTTDQDCGT